MKTSTPLQALWTRLAVVVAVGVMPIGCTNVPKVIRQTPLKPGPKCRPVMLQRVVAKLERGAKIGTTYPLGLPPQSLRWQGGRVSWDPEQFSDELRHKFTSIGLTVVGDPTALFSDPEADRAEFLIGALVSDIKMSLVFPLAQYGNYDSGSGSAYLKVEWQVYEQRTRSVCLKTITEGSAHDVNLEGSGGVEPLMLAFGMAAENLLAEKKFMNLVAPEDSAKPTERPSPIVVDLVGATSSTEPNQATIDNARVSVLTIFGSFGSGSGFIISTDGYLLTNQHVVGDARNVTAETLTGRKIHGEVIRVDRARDVALVKLEKDQYQPLSLGNSNSVRPGQDAYAIGSPRGHEFGQSITRGVVSGFRSIDDLRLIQSDVAINPGNSGGPLLSANGVVIGIAVSGRRDAQGMNFFIPIEEAITALGIVETSPSENSTSEGKQE
ncbi:hypothetical protein B7486_07720 [cyanobacterium TDX16]|nr:hypothetical protein B7486_07720 [cyanobacterium TDX16]